MADSGIEFYSWGYAAEDIKEDDPYLLIHPVEKLPTTTGDPNDMTNNKTYVNDSNDGVVSTSVNTSSNLRAKWLAWNSSNGFPPYICKGEQVLVIRFGGSTEFFWISVSNEHQLRKLEKVVMLASNKRSPGQTDKHYYFLIDTINKFVRLHTDASDGEACSYDVDFDTKKGIYTFRDSFNNEKELDSVNGILTTNINKQSIENIGDDIVSTSGKTIERNTKKYTNNSEEFNVNTKKASINLETLSISNGGNELISVLLELMDALLAEQHVGNLGSPTPLTGASAARYNAIKAKIKSFKA